MADTTLISIPESERRRQAVSAIRGYIYQIYASAFAWAGLEDDETLLLETAEDYAVLVRDALTVHQVKDAPASGAVTLRSAGVLETINAFWRLRTANPSLKIRAAYLATAVMGRERQSPLPAGVQGLQAWRAAALEGAALGPLRALLESLPLDAALKTWISGASDVVLQEELLRKFRWEVGQPDLQGLDDLFAERLILAADKRGLLPSDARSAQDALLAAVMQRIVDPESRQLTKADFLQALEQATTITVSRSTLRHSLAGSADSVLVDARSIPLPTLTVDRAEAGRAVQEALTRHETVWVYGASGSGKTTVAIQAANAFNRVWHVVALGHLKTGQVSERLRQARLALASGDFGGLILNDMPTAASGDLRLQLSLLQAAVRLADAGLIVTAYREAPPSLAALFQQPVLPLAAPPLDEDEIGAMVARLGGDPEFWKRSIRLASGGHPQLAAARITGLRARQWPKAEQLSGLLPDLPADDIDMERDAVRERLIGELPERARALLYRLSLLLTGFDRELVMSIADAAPPLAQPGEALDFLLGPWIETPRAGRLRVSPLVSDAGSRTLSAAEQGAVHRAICQDIAGRRPIPGEHLQQLLLSGLIARDAAALRVVALCVVMARPEDREAVLAELETLILLPTDRAMVDGDADTAALLRLAQLKIAVARADGAPVRAILDRALVEAVATGREADYVPPILFAVLQAETASVDPQTWFGLLERLDAFGLTLPEKRKRALRRQTGYAGSDNPADFMFVWRAAHIASVDELSQIFDVLGGVDPALRRRYLNALRETASGLRAALQSPWVRQSETPGFDPVAAAAPYARLETIAAGWGEAEIATECVAARSTLLSEYGQRHEEALTVLTDADIRWPGSPRLQRERIKIAFRLGRHDDVIAETQRYLARDVADPIDRVHALREMAVSTARIGDYLEAAVLFGQAAEDAAPVPTLTAMQAGLLADKAHVAFAGGRREAALRAYLEAAPLIDRLDPDAMREAWVIRTATGVGAWMVNQLAGGDMALTGARIGACSGHVDDIAWSSPVPRPEAVWYQAAAIERQLKLDIGVRAAVQTRIQGRRLVGFEMTFSQERLEDAAGGASEAELLSALANQARIVAYVDAGGFSDIGELLHQTGDAMPWDAMSFDLGDPRIKFPVEDALAIFIIGNLVRNPHFTITALAEGLGASPGMRPLAQPVLRWSQTLSAEMDPLAATLAAAAIVLGPPTGDASLLMLAAFRLWEWMGRSPGARRLEAALASRIAGQWLHLVDNAAFALRTPALTTPGILRAARQASDRSSVARLLLAADPAVSLRLGAGVRIALEADADLV